MTPSDTNSSYFMTKTKIKNETLCKKNVEQSLSLFYTIIYSDPIGRYDNACRFD